MARLSSRSSRRGPARRGQPSTQLSDNNRGPATARHYNVVAGRPRPPLVSLEQRIQVAMCLVTDSFLVSSVAVPAYASSQFTISGFADNAAYLSLFDQYRIDQIECWLEPTAAQGTTVFSDLATCVDLDDATAPTSYASVEGHQGSLSGLGGNGRYHKWQPHIAVSAYQGTFAGFTNIPATWIDSASPNVQHYGFKCAVVASPVAITYNLHVRALVSFRAPGL